MLTTHWDWENWRQWRPSILDIAQDPHVIDSFSANVRQCNIALTVVHVQVCFKSFIIIIVIIVIIIVIIITAV